MHHGVNYAWPELEEMVSTDENKWGKMASSRPWCKRTTRSLHAMRSKVWSKMSPPLLPS